MNYWETLVKLRIPCTLLETPLIRNIWRISPQQLSWLEEWKPNISNILYMEWNMAKHINTNAHCLWHFGTRLSQNGPTASAAQRSTCHLFGSAKRPFQLPCLNLYRRLGGWSDGKPELPCDSMGSHTQSGACSPLQRRLQKSKIRKRTMLSPSPTHTELPVGPPTPAPRP